MDFASEQTCKLAADGEAEAGAAVFSAGARVRLLKRLKDQLLLFRGNTNAGVGSLKGDNGWRVIQDRMLGAPASHRGRNVQSHAAFCRELERVRQQVFQHLLQPLRIGDDAAAQIGIEIDVERQLAIFGFVPERSSDRLKQVRRQDSSASTVTVPDSIFDRSRISLIRLSRSVPAP